MRTTTTDENFLESMRTTTTDENFLLQPLIQQAERLKLS